MHLSSTIGQVCLARSKRIAALVHDDKRFTQWYSLDLNRVFWKGSQFYCCKERSHVLKWGTIGNIAGFPILDFIHKWLETMKKTFFFLVLVFLFYFDFFFFNNLDPIRGDKSLPLLWYRRTPSLAFWLALPESSFVCRLYIAAAIAAATATAAAVAVVRPSFLPRLLTPYITCHVIDNYFTVRSGFTLCFFSSCFFLFCFLFRFYFYFVFLLVCFVCCRS